MNLADRSQPPAALLLDVAWCEPALSELPVVGARGQGTMVRNALRTRDDNLYSAMA